MVLLCSSSFSLTLPIREFEHLRLGPLHLAKHGDPACSRVRFPAQRRRRKGNEFPNPAGTDGSARSLPRVLLRLHGGIAGGEISSSIALRSEIFLVQTTPAIGSSIAPPNQG